MQRCPCRCGLPQLTLVDVLCLITLLLAKLAPTVIAADLYEASSAPSASALYNPAYSPPAAVAWALPSPPVAWLVSLLAAAALLMLSSLTFGYLDELKADMLNELDCCDRMNRLVVPSLALRALLLLHGLLYGALLSVRSDIYSKYNILEADRNPCPTASISFLLRKSLYSFPRAELRSERRPQVLHVGVVAGDLLALPTAAAGTPFSAPRGARAAAAARPDDCPPGDTARH